MLVQYKSCVRMSWLLKWMHCAAHTQATMIMCTSVVCGCFVEGVLVLPLPSVHSQHSRTHSLESLICLLAHTHSRGCCCPVPNSTARVCSCSRDQAAQAGTFGQGLIVADTHVHPSSSMLLFLFSNRIQRMPNCVLDKQSYKLHTQSMEQELLGVVPPRRLTPLLLTGLLPVQAVKRVRRVASCARAVHSWCRCQR